MRLYSKIKTLLAILISKRFYSGRVRKIIIKRPILISKGIQFKNNISIWHNARIELVTKYNQTGFSPRLIIGEDVSIQQNCHITCAEEVIIGDGTAITENVGIFDIHHPYEDIKVSPKYQDITTNRVSIGKNCLIGMNSVILPGTRLGEHNVVGANSLVRGEFPDYCIIAGNPAKVIKRYNQQTRSWEKTNCKGEFEIE